MNSEDVRVLGVARWEVHGTGVSKGSGGLDGQLTKCVLGGRIFYVRENLDLPHFHMNSGERLRMKQGMSLPSRGRQVLELCASTDVWDSFAALVRSLDGGTREVRRNARFTADWAERFFVREPVQLRLWSEHRISA